MVSEEVSYLHEMLYRMTCSITYHSESIGTGWVAYRELDKALIVTAAHVIENNNNSSNIGIEFFKSSIAQDNENGNPCIENIHIISTDEDKDCAFILISKIPDNIERLPLSFRYNKFLSTECITYAYGEDLKYKKAASGKVLGSYHYGKPDKLMYTIDSTSMNVQGCSGAPIVCKKNQVVFGIITGFKGQQVVAVPLASIEEEYRAYLRKHFTIDHSKLFHSKLFVDRKKDIELFWDCIKSNSLSYLEYFGISGVGKTYLVKEIHRKCKKRENLIVSYIDFRSTELQTVECYPILKKISEDFSETAPFQNFFTKIDTIIHNFDKSFDKANKNELPENERLLRDKIIDLIDLIIEKYNYDIVLLLDSIESANFYSFQTIENQFLSFLHKYAKVNIVAVSQIPIQWNNDKMIIKAKAKAFSKSKQIESFDDYTLTQQIKSYLEFADLNYSIEEQQLRHFAQYINKHTYGHPLSNYLVIEDFFFSSSSINSLLVDEKHFYEKLKNSILILKNQFIENYLNEKLFSLNDSFCPLKVFRYLCLLGKNFRFDVALKFLIKENFSFFESAQNEFGIFIGKLEDINLLNTSNNFNIHSTLKNIFCLDWQYNHRNEYIQLNSDLADIYMDLYKNNENKDPDFFVRHIFHYVIYNFYKDFLSNLAYDVKEYIKKIIKSGIIRDLSELFNIKLAFQRERDSCDNLFDISAIHCGNDRISYADPNVSCEEIIDMIARISRMPT